MNDLWILGIGFLAQVFFSLRFLLQWLASEKAEKIKVPSIFWSFSLMGSILLFIYGFLRDDFPIMLGQLLTYYIYIRNLQLQKVWSKINKIIRWMVILFPIAALFIFVATQQGIDLYIFDRIDISTQLLVFGIIGQVLFVGRFIVQWVISESIQSSTLPNAFWYLSILGTSLILIYGIIRIDIVLIIAHSVGILIYSRNLFIAKNARSIRSRI
ncbi:MAG: lipid-A-disaccharide synthase N-terminal domain-containing protein [Psychroserpens sp.]|nr:lipid-A-disaccharide synthase N-terminal domain-containing protein [Psychroserpens sp.]